MVIERCHRHHRHRRLLNECGAKVPMQPGVVVPMVMDDSSFLEMPAVKLRSCLLTECHRHLTWMRGIFLNLVDPYFAEITDNQVPRGTCRYVTVPDGRDRGVPGR